MMRAPGLGNSHERKAACNIDHLPAARDWCLHKRTGQSSSLSELQAPEGSVSVTDWNTQTHPSHQRAAAGRPEQNAMVQSIFLRVSRAFRAPFWIRDTPAPMLIFVATRQVDGLTIKDLNERGLGHLHFQGCMRVRHRFSHLVGSTSGPFSSSLQATFFTSGRSLCGETRNKHVVVVLTSQQLSTKKRLDGARHGPSDMIWFATSTYYALC
jgi:hypothetical protein